MFAPPIAKQKSKTGAPKPGVRVGAAGGALEHEADRAADAALLQAGGVRPGLTADAGRPVERELNGPGPESFAGRGSPLPSPLRGLFEKRFQYSFGDVRVHDGPDAAESARGLGARAYTHGRDVVFGAGEYSPKTASGARLLGHELAHVVQQRSGQAGNGRSLVQRSPLSDQVKKDWKADGKIETLLARLGKDDVQQPPGNADADVDAMLAAELASKPDDLWVAQRIRQGELGKTTGKFGPKDKKGHDVARPIQAFFFKGTTERRALVIAGVHGTERQGMEVAQDLIRDLKDPKNPAPVLSTIIVPSLFPDNAAVTDPKNGADNGGRGTRESGATPTNRNFPPPSEDLADATAAGGGKAVDASKAGGKRTREILPENQLLMQMIEKFHPERILSIHGTSGAGSAGVFYDPRSLSPDELKAARDWARGNAYMRTSPQQEDEPGAEARMHELEEGLYRQRVAQLTGQASDTDRDLALNTAKKIDADTTNIKGREKRGMDRENDTAKTTAADRAGRKAHPSVAGNVGSTGQLDNPGWSGSVPGGTSLGGYAPPRGISVFTIEPALDLNTGDYKGKKDDIAQAARQVELQAYADAVRTILLGT